jgi:hypothetical protein
MWMVDGLVLIIKKWVSSSTVTLFFCTHSVLVKSITGCRFGAHMVLGGKEFNGISPSHEQNMHKDSLINSFSSRKNKSFCIRNFYQKDTTGFGGLLQGLPNSMFTVKTLSGSMIPWL